jgi:hypothetical protein
MFDVFWEERVNHGGTETQRREEKRRGISHR